MKTNLLITLVLFFFFGCAKQPAQMSPQEQETAKKEIRQIFDLQIAACEKPDLDALFQAMWNSPDFIAIMADGKTFDYQGAKNSTADFFKAFPSAKFTTVKDEFRFLSNDLVLYAWNGTCDMTLTTGAHSKIDSYAVTYVFRKIDNQWKIIFSHESASPAVEERAKAKK